MNTKYTKKLKNWIIGVAGVMLVTSVAPASAQIYHDVTRLGTSQAICTPGVESGEELQAFFANNPQVVRNILASANWSGDPQDLIDAVAAGDFTAEQYVPGTEFQWMSSRVDGTESALPYRRWMGSEAFDGFEINVVSNCQQHQIVVPNACCNVSLIASTPVTVGECAPEVVQEEAPAPAPAPVPEVVKGDIVPFIGVLYGSETRLRYEPSWDMDMHDSSGVSGIKVGILSPINDTLSWFAQGGYISRKGINSGNVYPSDNYFADIGVEQKLGTSGFVGAGVGVWNIDDRTFDDGSFFIHGGSSIGNTPLDWFIEGRAFFDSGGVNELEDNKMFSAGLRYQFK
ncbi:MAG: hypothetical protein HOM55_08465 [Proteobacteria bacterium]|jgi:hypothetical protein|nr:hypothetical protein [Pseudomonadota bacterium]